MFRSLSAAQALCAPGARAFFMASDWWANNLEKGVDQTSGREALKDLTEITRMDAGR